MEKINQKNTELNKTKLSMLFTKRPFSVVAEAKLLEEFIAVKGEIKSKKICGNDNCFQFTAAPYAGAGFGVEGGVGYTSNAEKKDTLTFSAGLGVIPMLGVKIKVEREPKQQNTDNTPVGYPKPSL
ncbi:MAG: hypothetical protein ABSA84_02115 [Gammaproteobacteria bacterium]